MVSVHPAVVRRLMDIQRKHRAALPVGELTAAEELKRLDPHGLLSLAEELSGEMVRRAMEEARTEAMLTLTETGGAG